MGPKVVRLSDELDRWRYRCPRGHVGWEPTNNHFWCAQCARQHDDVDPEFDVLHDEKTGTEYARDEVRLLTPAGPYSDSGHGGSS